MDSRKIIEFNHLDELAMELNVSQNYILVLEHMKNGKKNAQIAREIGISPSRVAQMYWQYVKWCREYTGLKYFEDCHPIPREKYDELWKKQKDKFRTAPEIEQAIIKEIKDREV